MVGSFNDSHQYAERHRTLTTQGTSVVTGTINLTGGKTWNQAR